eukprot:gene16744-biopygen520
MEPYGDLHDVLAMVIYDGGDVGGLRVNKFGWLRPNLLTPQPNATIVRSQVVQGGLEGSNQILGLLDTGGHSDESVGDADLHTSSTSGRTLEMMHTALEMMQTHGTFDIGASWQVWWAENPDGKARINPIQTRSRGEEAIAIHQEEKEEEKPLHVILAATEERLEAILWVKGTKDLEQLNQDGLREQHRARRITITKGTSQAMIAALNKHDESNPPPKKKIKKNQEQRADPGKMEGRRAKKEAHARLDNVPSLTYSAQPEVPVRKHQELSKNTGHDVDPWMGRGAEAFSAWVCGGSSPFYNIFFRKP